MPGQHSDEDKERKERIKKLKAKTSKMRLAVVKTKEKIVEPDGERFKNQGRLK